MKNKRGFTLVELLVSFVLITAVSVALFRTTLSMQQKQQVNLAKNKYKAFTTVLNNTIQKDFLTDRILSMTENDTNSFEIVYEKKGKVNFTVDRENNTIIYGGTKEKLPSDYKFYDDVTIRFYDNTAATEGLNSHVVITIPVKSGLEPDLDEIKYMYQYNNVEHKIDVDTSLGDNMRGATKIINLVNPQGSNGVIRENGVRYVGANPNNYVWFNCNSTDANGVEYGNENYTYDTTSCELWRIIGVFDVASEIGGRKESRIKLINTSSTFQASWDSSASIVNKGYGINQWGATDSYEGADLMRLLNGYYIKEELIKGEGVPACTYCNNLGQSACTQTENCTSLKQLTKISLDMIRDAEWYTYAVKYPSSGSAYSNYASNAYSQERGITNKFTGKDCEPDELYCSDTVERTAKWKGKVGLMYASDMMYANGWLYNGTYFPWTITPNSYFDRAVRVWRSYSTAAGTYATSYSYVVWPSVYLKTEVQIIEGNGTSTKTTDGTGPYVLKLN